MKIYKYKIQWLFTCHKEGLKAFKRAINLFGVRSLDKICLRGKDYRIIHTYYDFIQFPSDVAEIETMKYIKRALKTKNADYIEIIKN